MRMRICRIVRSWNRNYCRVIRSLPPDGGITGCRHIEIKFIWCCSEAFRSYIDEILSDEVTKNEEYFMLITRSKISWRYHRNSSFLWRCSIGSSVLTDSWGGFLKWFCLTCKGGKVIWNWRISFCENLCVFIVRLTCTRWSLWFWN